MYEYAAAEGFGAGVTPTMFEPFLDYRNTSKPLWEDSCTVYGTISDVISKAMAYVAVLY